MSKNKISYHYKYNLGILLIITGLLLSLSIYAQTESRSSLDASRPLFFNGADTNELHQNVIQEGRQTPRAATMENPYPPIIIHKTHGKKEDKPIGAFSVYDERFQRGGIFENLTPTQEDISKRTQYSKKFKTSDTTAKVIIGGPFHYFDKNGSLQDIDLRIKNANLSSFKYENTSNLFKTYFYEDVKQGILMTVKDLDLYFGIQPQIFDENNNPLNSYKIADISIADNILRYENFYESVKMEYRLTTGAVYQNWIFENPTFINNIQGSQNIIVKESIELPSGIVLFDKNGRISTNREVNGFIYAVLEDDTIFSFAPSIIWDNSFNGNIFNLTDEERNSNSVFFPKTQVEFSENNTIDLKITLPVSWFLEQGRSYPVYLDPTVIVDGPGINYYEYPWETDRWQRVSQMIFVSADIGYTGTITRIAFQQQENNAAVNQNATIKYQTTTASAFTGPVLLTSGWTHVYGPATLDYTTGNGWRWIDITDFTYNGGINNLMIEARYQNNGKAPGGNWFHWQCPETRHRWGYCDNCTDYPPPLYENGITMHRYGWNTPLVQLDMITGGCNSGNNSQCTYTPICNGLQEDFCDCTWAGQYSTIELIEGNTYFIGSSTISDYITITDNTTNIIEVHGNQPIEFTPDATTTYRVYVHTGASCGVEQICRTTWVQCGTVTETCCIAASPWQTSSAPTDNNEIITASWILVNEYNTIHNVVAGETYRFQVRDVYNNTNATDWLSLTNTSNTCLAFGTSTIIWTATYSGTVRLHFFNESTCGTTSLPDRHVYVQCVSCALVTCNPETIPYFEGFTGVDIDEIPECWTRQPNTINWRVINASGAGGTVPEIGFSWYPVATDTFELISPEINGVGKSNLVLKFIHSFWHFSYISDYDIKVIITKDNGSTWQTIWEMNLNNTNTTYNTFVFIEEEQVIDISQVDGHVFRVAWVFEGNTDNINSWQIDDIFISEAPATPAISLGSSPPHCGSAILQFNGTPPSGQTWYWQTTPNGTDMTNAASPYTVSNSGTYYLRSYRTSDGMWSASTSITVTIFTIPDAPVAEAPSNITNNSFTANWNAVAGATAYNLDVSVTSDFSTFVSGYNNLDVGNNTSHNVTGLQAGTIYFYRVRATANGCTSNNSMEASTDACTLPTLQSINYPD